MSAAGKQRTDILVAVLRIQCCQLLGQSRNLLREAPSLDQVLGPATVAATIARRPFLAGMSGCWEESQRRRLERQLVRSLDCLAEMRIAYGEADLAVETAIEAVGLDPFRERSHQLLMQGYAATGNRARAVEAYHNLRKRLAEEVARLAKKLAALDT